MDATIPAVRFEVINAIDAVSTFGFAFRYALMEMQY
jgi:hypothetical protein